MSIFAKPLAFIRNRFPLWLRQAVKFGMVGVLNTLVDLGVYALLVHLAGLMVDLLQARLNNQNDQPPPEVIQPRLVVRASTG